MDRTYGMPMTMKWKSLTAGTGMLVAAMVTIPAADAGGRRVNAAGDSSAVPADVARDCFAHFAEDYAACDRRFPEVATLWPHAHLMG